VAKAHGISDQTVYNWRQRFGGMTINEVKRLKLLEKENARLKKLLAEKELSLEVLKEINGKKW
jgi:putative transposase